MKITELSLSEREIKERVLYSSLNSYSDRGIWMYSHSYLLIFTPHDSNRTVKESKTHFLLKSSEWDLFIPIHPFICIHHLYIQPSIIEPSIHPSTYPQSICNNPSIIHNPNPICPSIVCLWSSINKSIHPPILPSFIIHGKAFTLEGRSGSLLVGRLPGLWFSEAAHTDRDREKGRQVESLRPLLTARLVGSALSGPRCSHAACPAAWAAMWLSSDVTAAAAAAQTRLSVGPVLLHLQAGPLRMCMGRGSSHRSKSRIHAGPVDPNKPRSLVLWAPASRARLPGPSLSMRKPKVTRMVFALCLGCFIMVILYFNSSLKPGE